MFDFAMLRETSLRVSDIEKLTVFVQWEQRAANVDVR